MKKKLNLLFAVMLFIGISASAQSVQTEEFIVFGNCGMCKGRIEKAAKSVEGVSTAEWNKKTKKAKITFNSKKTNILAIHKAIAKVGHDTEKYKADDKIYNELPACCLYERELDKKKEKQKEKKK